MKTNQFIKIGMFALLASTSLIAESNSAFAQNSTGNGGDAIVCGNDAVMLDYYEGLQKGYNFGLMSPKFSVQENVNIVLQSSHNLPSISELAKDLTFDLTEAYSENGIDIKRSKIAYGIQDDLVDIDDSKELFIPKACKKVQIAIQSTPRVKGDKFIVVHIPTLQKMNSMQKAILIMHEAIYWNAKAKNTDSIGTRFFNSMISTQDLSKMEFVEYNNLIKSVLKIDIVDMAKRFFAYLDNVRSDQ